MEVPSGTTTDDTLTGGPENGRLTTALSLAETS